MTADRLAHLSPGDRAAFATSARLFSCLVTESILRGLYFPLSDLEATGVCVVLNADVSAERPYESKDIFAIVPLYHVPVFKHDGADSRTREISLLDPFDMMPLVFEVDSDGAQPLESEVSFVVSVDIFC